MLIKTREFYNYLPMLLWIILIGLVLSLTEIYGFNSPARFAVR